MQGEYYQRLPIIALTANAVNGVREMFLEAGFNDFLAKPIELSALDRVLKAWLPDEYIMPPVLHKKNATSKEAKAAHKEKGLISVSSGLHYAGGNEEAYFEILDMYVRKGTEKQQCINKLCQIEDWKNYIIEVHALKSTSMSVGAAELSKLAKKLDAIWSLLVRQEIIR